MLPSRLYTIENVDRARYAQYGVVAVSGLICLYLIITTFTGMREVWNTQSALRSGREESIKLAHEVKELRQQSKNQPAPDNGGLEQFAVQLSQWAGARGVRIESFAPEGSASPTEVTHENAKLGLWNTNKVRVKGSGLFPQFISLMAKLTNPGMPVQLESFQIQSGGSGREGLINFNLMLTVYEKKDGAS